MGLDLDVVSLVNRRHHGRMMIQKLPTLMHKFINLHIIQSMLQPPLDFLFLEADVVLLPVEFTISKIHKFVDHILESLF